MPNKLIDKRMVSTSENPQEIPKRLPLQARIVGYLWIIACGSAFISEQYFGSNNIFSLLGVYFGYQLLSGHSRGRNVLLYVSWLTLAVFTCIVGILVIVSITQSFSNDLDFNGKIEVLNPRAYFLLILPANSLFTVVALSSRKAARHFLPDGYRSRAKSPYQFRLEHLLVLMTLVSVTMGIISFRYQFLEQRNVVNLSSKQTSFTPCYLVKVFSYSGDLRRMEITFSTPQDFSAEWVSSSLTAAKLECKGLSPPKTRRILARSTIQIGRDNNKHLVPLLCSKEFAERYVRECPPSDSVDDYHRFVESIELAQDEARQDEHD